MPIFLRPRGLRLADKFALGLVALSLFVLTGGSLLLSSGVLEPAWNRLSPQPDRIVLTWSGDPATTQSVTWRTDITVSEAVAQYAIAEAGPDFRNRARTVRATSELFDGSRVPQSEYLAKFHSVTFTDLVPDTTYAYRVGDGARWSEWFHFRTASLEAKPFSFIYFGDAQNDILSLWSRTIRSSYAAAPDARFMIHAGDLINTAHDDKQWGEWFEAGGWIHPMLPSVPATGNHEYRAITTAEEEAGIRHLSVLWKPVLDKHGVDLVLQGHDHTYARGRTFLQEANAGVGANARDPRTGTVYVVSVSGPKMYEFKPEQWGQYDAALDRRAENTQLFQVIRIDGDKLEYRAHTALGQLYDSFDLVRDNVGNRFIEHMPSDAEIRAFADTLQSR